jgi:hypothetical protein
MAGKKKLEEPKVELPKAPERTELPPPIVAKAALQKAFYIEKEKGVWRLIIADVEDDKLVNKKIKVADNKALALEYFKIAFAKHYFFGR